MSDAPLPLFEFAEATVQPGSNMPPVETGPEPEVELPRMTTGENVIQDYRATSLSLRPHPMGLLRPTLKDMGLATSRDLATLPNNKRVRVAGLVLVRQRPGTASGVIFATLEDETGVSNIIIWPKTFDTYRRDVLGAKLMIVEGKLQREDIVTHVIADRITDGTHLLGRLGDMDAETDFSGMLSRADEMAKPPPGSVKPIREVIVNFPNSRDFH